MKKILLFLLLMIFTISIFPNDFQKANIEVSGSNYDKAIELYNLDLEKNGPSFNTLYNLGNAHYEQKELGLALYNLRKAHIINPRNRNLNSLIRIIEEDLNHSNKKLVTRLPFSPREVQVTLLISLLLLALILFTASLLRFLEIRNNWFYRKKHIILIVTLSIVFISSLLNIVNYKEKNSGIVIETSNVLISPYTGSKDSFSINEGTHIKVSERFEDFYYITDSNKRYGWIGVESVGTFWKK